MRWYYPQLGINTYFQPPPTYGDNTVSSNSCEGVDIEITSGDDSEIEGGAELPPLTSREDVLKVETADNPQVRATTSNSSPGCRAVVKH